MWGIIVILPWLNHLGTKGTHGETGERGPKGEQGEKGPKGEQGKLGEPGISVTNSETVRSTRPGKNLSISLITYFIAMWYKY